MSDETSSIVWLTLAEFAIRLGDPDWADEWSPLGPAPIVAVPLESDTYISKKRLRTGIAIGVDSDGRLPKTAAPLFDILLTSARHAPKPWIFVEPSQLTGIVERIAAHVRQCPVAACTLAQVLVANETMDFDQALLIESLAYSTLLAGQEFHAWRAAHPPRAPQAEKIEPVRIEFEDTTATLTLTRAARRNAYSARMRDRLVEHLRALMLNEKVKHIVLRGEGPGFSSGGDLEEFGSAPDPATAHIIRIQRSAAQLVHTLRDRVQAHLHGACIGAGIEIPAAASRVVANAGAFFQLPEVSMGLIPGAGGTVTVPRRIGRHRTCFMALTGEKIDCETAMDWGLIDAYEDN